MLSEKKLEKAVREEYPGRKNQRIVEKVVKEVIKEERQKEMEELGKTVAGTD